MDALELCQLVTSARETQFGTDITTEQWPAEFFRYDVVTTAPNGQTTPRAPKYCATNEGGAYINNTLNASGRVPLSTVILAPAIALAGGFSDSDNVPWLQFQTPIENGTTSFSGPTINAGLLLDYFNHANSPVSDSLAARALNSCQLEYSDAAGIPLTDDQRNAIMAQPLP